MSRRKVEAAADVAEPIAEVEPEPEETWRQFAVRTAPWLMLWYVLGFQIPRDYPELMSPPVSFALNMGSVLCLWYKVR